MTQLGTDIAKHMLINIQDSKARIQATVLMGGKRTRKQASLALLNVYLPTQEEGDEREKPKRGVSPGYKGPNLDPKETRSSHPADERPELC